MRIGIDARYLSHGLVGGVHTYVRHFVPELIEQATDCEIVLYADSRRPFELAELPAHVTLRTLPYKNALSTIQHDLLLRRQIERDRLDVVHFPANYGVGPRGTRTVLTIHDAINLLPLREIVRGHPKRPGTIAKMTYLHVWTRFSARRADLILTVSKYAAGEIARAGRLDPERIVPIPHAPTPDLLQPADPTALLAVREKYAIGQPFVLADALKNPATLVRAWDRLPESLRARNQLIFFCRRDDVPAPVLDAERRRAARVLRRPERADLIALFRLAQAFAFPSWIEGFGIPVLEAMTCGAPVIASDRGAIPEVAGDAALLADAEDDAAFARHLEAVLTNSGLAARLRKSGFARAAQFSWSGTARQILDGYARAGAGVGVHGMSPTPTEVRGMNSTSTIVPSLRDGGDRSRGLGKPLAVAEAGSSTQMPSILVAERPHTGRRGIHSTDHDGRSPRSPHDDGYPPRSLHHDGRSLHDDGRSPHDDGLALHSTAPDGPVRHPSDSDSCELHATNLSDGPGAGS